MKSLRSTWLRFVVVIAVDVILVAALFGLYITAQLPRIPNTLENLNPQSGVNIFASDGTFLYSLNRARTFVPLEEMSPQFTQAVLATEDLNFFHHHGISIKGLAGAFLDNLASWRKTRGGSTITQQIVKNIFLTREKSYVRKAKELMIAVQLETMFERAYSEDYKDRLLELYINGSFYGTNAYGVEDAARVYFDRSAKDLTLLQSAVLAGLPNAPSAYRPVYGDSSAIAIATKRATHVLNRMVVAGFIEPADRDSALTDDLQLNPEKRIQNRTPYLVETIKEEVSRRWGGSALSFGALDIHTTLDLQMQQNAQKSISQGVDDLDERLGFTDYQSASQAERRSYVQAALLCVDFRTGHVKAMVGGRDIFTSYYNRATTARRQPGSGFKPIVYLSAFETEQVTPLSLFLDEPRTYTVNGHEWSPKNFQDSYLGQTTAAWALTKSANATSVQIVKQIGPERVVNTAKRIGINSPLLPVPSIALGSSEVTMLDLVTAYGTIANAGLRLDPTFISRIVDRNTGKVLYQHRPNPRPVVDPVHAYTVTRLMENVVNVGTGYAVRRSGLLGSAAGKTGTTNDNTDAWFTGFTPEYVTSVWIGFDSRSDGNRLREKKSRRQITGGSGAAPVWASFMKTLPTTDRRFYAPAGTKELEVAPHSGQIPSAGLDSLGIRPIRITVPEHIEPNVVDALVDTEGP